MKVSPSMSGSKQFGSMATRPISLSENCRKYGSMLVSAIRDCRKRVLDQMPARSG